MTVRFARVARCTALDRESSTGRVRCHFRIDGLEHVVHALYHDPPRLAPGVWAACIEELALACLVDVSTATLARGSAVPFPVGRHATRAFVAAAEALRLEVVAGRSGALTAVRSRLATRGRARALEDVPATLENRILLLMGGGKDSLYCSWLLRQAGYDVRCFYMTEPRRTWQQLRRVYRALSGMFPQDRAFLDVTRRRPLERHFGAQYLSQFQIGQAIALSLPYALAQGCRYIALGLERSADAPMRRYHGRPVNHQHQKSSRFVRLLNRHLAWRYRGAVQVVSPVHGLYDTGIYARFLRSDSSLVRLQSSCGGANGRRAHCGRCAKCAFLAALLAGLSGDRSLYGTLFPTDPLAHLTVFRPWLGNYSARPLTCAGFREELLLALRLVQARGWASIVARQWRVHTSAARTARDLRRYLAAYPTPLVPAEMARKLAPLLDSSWDDLRALLNSSEAARCATSTSPSSSSSSPFSSLPSFSSPP